MLVINSEKLPIKVWAKDADLVGYESAIDQAKNLANHPLARKWVCLMPDFHVGYGMPIGGVLATKGGVVPNAVGVDIGCGMVACKTMILADDIPKETLQKIRLSIHEKVPVGKLHHKDSQENEFLDEHQAEVEVITDPVLSDQWENAYYQMGTLGGGNHFIELQKDENGFLWIMIHSGSRNLGKKVCDYYHGVAKHFAEMFHSKITDLDLAFLPVGFPEHDMYMGAMELCMEFAEQSRLVMLHRVLESIEENTKPFNYDEPFDTHHNFAALENHYGENLMIHRKGAVKAKGLLTIPGSMGTCSYICKGLEPKESFNTCSHGAGRVLGRKDANRKITHEQAVDSMKHVVFGIKHGDYDETPMCYKDIEKVIEYQSEFVEPIHRLLPLAVVKG